MRASLRLAALPHFRSDPAPDGRRESEAFEDDARSLVKYLLLSGEPAGLRFQSEGSGEVGMRWLGPEGALRHMARPSRFLRTQIEAAPGLGELEASVLFQRCVRELPVDPSLPLAGMGGAKREIAARAASLFPAAIVSAPRLRHEPALSRCRGILTCLAREPDWFLEIALSRTIPDERDLALAIATIRSVDETYRPFADQSFDPTYHAREMLKGGIWFELRVTGHGNPGELLSALLHDFGADSFCLADEAGTAAALPVTGPSGAPVEAKQPGATLTTISSSSLSAAFVVN